MPKGVWENPGVLVGVTLEAVILWLLEGEGGSHLCAEEQVDGADAWALGWPGQGCGGDGRREGRGGGGVSGVWVQTGPRHHPAEPATSGWCQRWPRGTCRPGRAA